MGEKNVWPWHTHRCLLPDDLSKAVSSSSLPSLTWLVSASKYCTLLIKPLGIIIQRLFGLEIQHVPWKNSLSENRKRSQPHHVTRSTNLWRTTSKWQYYAPLKGSVLIGSNLYMNRNSARSILYWRGSWKLSWPNEERKSLLWVQNELIAMNTSTPLLLYEHFYSAKVGQDSAVTTRRACSLSSIPPLPPTPPSWAGPRCLWP